MDVLTHNGKSEPLGVVQVDERGDDSGSKRRDPPIDVSQKRLCCMDDARGSRGLLAGLSLILKICSSVNDIRLRP
jgi:hypothetical protein